MSIRTKATYETMSVATSVAGGLLAGALFNRVWEALSGHDEPPPDPKDLHRSTSAALAGAALQGLVFGVVRAGVDRIGARGYEAVVHESAV